MRYSSRDIQDRDCDHGDKLLAGSGLILSERLLLQDINSLIVNVNYGKKRFKYFFNKLPA